MALWGISTPNFWLGILLIFLFAVHLGWLPASGYVGPFEDLWLSLQTTILPAFVLGNSFAAVLMRHTRSAMLQAMGSDYVRTARAKGLAERIVVLKHAMRNALTPVVTLGALELGTLLSGAVLTEQVFSIPGFGKLIVDSVFNRDYAVVQGVTLITATTYILLNLLADIAYVLINPGSGASHERLRHSLRGVCSRSTVSWTPPTSRKGEESACRPVRRRAGAALLRHVARVRCSASSSSCCSCWLRFSHP